MHFHCFPKPYYSNHSVCMKVGLLDSRTNHTQIDSSLFLLLD